MEPHDSVDGLDYHRQARTALAAATEVLDAAEAWLRNTDLNIDIDTRN